MHRKRWSSSSPAPAAPTNEDRRFEPGKLADFVILSDNPEKIEPAKLWDLKVLETIKQGKTIYKQE